MRRRLWTVTLALFVLRTPMIAFGSTGPADGAVMGRVLDEAGGALPGVTVSLRNAGADRTAYTDEDGVYRFDHAPIGPSELTFTISNFGSLTRDCVVRAGQSTTVDVAMRLALAADVVVTGRATFRNLADVENPRESLVGIANAASQGAVTAAQIAARPIMRAGEVLESVPGMIVSQHSGEGKANQYYLRGFNLDHGTDFSTTVAGVPVNLPTGAHAHGYADVNFLIPELVSGVQFKKGPYYADEGDFSAAGAANINYVNALDRPLVSLSQGGQGWKRSLAAASTQLGSGTLLGALELTRNEGPWVRGDGYRRTNGVVRFSRGGVSNGLSITAMGYGADWESTDQVPLRAVESGLISPFGYIDATDRGVTSRQSVALEWQRSGAGAATRATVFALRNRLTLFSNFTYFLDDPVNGDQFEQHERRLALGARLTHRRLGRVMGRHAEHAVGLQLRQDWLAPVGLYRTQAGARLRTTREDRVRQMVGGTFAQSDVQWLRTLRTTIGLRADRYQYDVSSSLQANSGRGDDTKVSPKFTLVLGPWAATEIYANAGLGFHSNDARGVVTRVDPVSGQSLTPATPLVGARGAEVGLRTVRLKGVQSTVAVWYLGLDSELLFVGDAGTTEAGHPSRRVGIEWSTYARIRSWLLADADLSFAHARFVGPDGDRRYVPGALDRVLAGGVAADAGGRLRGSLRVRHFGPRPLVEDGTVRSTATTIWNAEAGWRLSRRAQLVVEGFNLFNTRASDIDYFYRSRLPGETLDGIDDVHTHPALPRSVRIGLEVLF